MLRYYKYLIKRSSPGFPLNFNKDYGSVTIIVFIGLAWRLFLSRISVSSIHIVALTLVIMNQTGDSAWMAPCSMEINRKVP
jgi:hypothetical protein